MGRMTEKKLKKLSKKIDFFISTDYLLIKRITIKKKKKTKE